MRTFGPAVRTVAVGCVAALLTGCGTVRQGGPLPQRPSPPTVSSVSSPLGIELTTCATTAFTGRLGGTGTGRGSELRHVVLTYTGLAACTMMPAPFAAAGFTADGSQQVLPVDRGLSSSWHGAVIELRHGQRIGAEVISPPPGACRAPVTMTSYTALAFSINGGYDPDISEQLNIKELAMARVDFPAGQPLQVLTCGSPPKVAGYQRP